MTDKEHFLNELREIKEKNKIAVVTIEMEGEEHSFPHTPKFIDSAIEHYDRLYDDNLHMKLHNKIRIIELDEV